jgi:hypothetical protein
MTPNRGEVTAHGQPPLRRPSRRLLAGALVVLTVVAMTAATVAIWTRQTVYDTDRFMATVEPALTDPTFYDGVSAIVTDASLEALDLESRIAALLDEVDASLVDALTAAIDPDPSRLEQLQNLDRPTLGILAPAISQPLEDRVADTVDAFLTSEAVQAGLPELVERTHAAGLALLTDDLAALPNVYVEADEVRIDLLPIVAEALRPIVAELPEVLPDVTLPPVVADATEQERERLRGELATALQARLPEDLGQVTVMPRSTLEEAQAVARYADRSVWALSVLAVILAVAAIGMSPDRRRTVVQLSLGVAGGLVTATLLVRQVEVAILARITDPDGVLALGSLLGQLVSDLRTVTLLVAVAALLIGVTAHLEARPTWAVSRLARGPAGSPQDR